MYDILCWYRATLAGACCCVNCVLQSGLNLLSGAQVLLNLVCTCLKFTHAGDVRVSASQTHSAASVVVADTGQGIPAEQLAHALDPFQQVMRCLLPLVPRARQHRCEGNLWSQRCSWALDPVGHGVLRCWALQFAAVFWGSVLLHAKVT
jgi:hypothetical protein